MYCKVAEARIFFEAEKKRFQSDIFCFAEDPDPCFVAVTITEEIGGIDLRLHLLPCAAFHFLCPRQNYVAIKSSNFLILPGCFSFFMAFASICLTLSEVIERCLPTSLKV